MSARKLEGGGFGRCGKGVEALIAERNSTSTSFGHVGEME